jgi:hypothetical protein
MFFFVLYIVFINKYFLDQAIKPRCKREKHFYGPEFANSQQPNYDKLQVLIVKSFKLLEALIHFHQHK